MCSQDLNGLYFFNCFWVSIYKLNIYFFMHRLPSYCLLESIWTYLSLSFRSELPMPWYWLRLVVYWLHLWFKSISIHCIIFFGAALCTGSGLNHMTCFSQWDDSKVNVSKVLKKHLRNLFSCTSPWKHAQANLVERQECHLGKSWTIQGETV